MFDLDKITIKLFDFWHGTHKSDWIEKNHRNYDYAMVYFSNGNCKVITEHQTFICTDNTLLILPPGVIQSSMALSAVTRYCIHIDFLGNAPPHPQHLRSYVFMDDPYPFDFKLIAKKVPEHILKFPLFIKFRDDQKEEMLSLMKKFFACRTDNLPDHLTRLSVVLEILNRSVLAATEHSSNIKPVNTIFAEAKNLFDRHYSDPAIKISSIAAILKISPNHLNKVFKQQTNLTCSEYLIQLRLNQACDMLSMSHYSVQEITVMCGFSDANYFARLFKKKFEMSPSQFRKKNTKDI